MESLKYANAPNANEESGSQRRVQHLTRLAKALAREIETLQSEFSTAAVRVRAVGFQKGGIDFYHEVESFEIELIKNALYYSGGNQAQAARLLQMKSTTLNSKLKHYGLNPVRSLRLHSSL